MVWRFPSRLHSRLTAADPSRRRSEAPIRRIATTLALVATVLAVLAGCAGSPAPGPRTTPSVTVDGQATLVRVVDGDTVVARIAGRDERVRLIGIDTPESVAPGTPVECFGKEASRHLSSLLPTGTALRLVGDAEQRDRYGRLLAYVYRQPDGLFVNEAMARDGFAAPLSIKPNVAHRTELLAAARSAHESRKGLWGACADADLSALASG